VRRFGQNLRDKRVTLSGLTLVSAVSVVVSGLIVAGALGQTGAEKAVIAALRTNQVIHASAPAVARTASAASPTASTTSSSLAARAPSSPGPSGGGGAGTGPGASSASATGGGSSSASSSSPAGSDSSGSSGSSGSSASGATSGSSSGSAAGTPNVNQPSGPTARVKHVFVIALSTPSYRAAFGRDSTARYLNSTLRPKGELLSRYHTLGSAELPDFLAMVSGQAANRDTRSGCSTYSEFPGRAAPAKDGLVSGNGCVYPNTALTVGDQLDGANLSWRGYIDGMSSPCQHPNSGALDDSGTSQYATSHNPFVYFHSLLDLGGCQSDDLPLGRLAATLRSASRTPSYSFISPNLCHGGASVTCPDGQQGGIAAVDDFLRQTVPGILSSPAYRAGGALVIAFTAASPAGQGAGRPVRTGALVLSPHTRPGGTAGGSYDPYSLLRTVEDVFGLTPLAKAKSAHGFDAKVFDR
jgi:hypothetical protein